MEMNKIRMKMNKKGSDIPSILYVVAMIFAIGLVVVLFSHFTLQIYQESRDTINGVMGTSASQANETLSTAIKYESSSMWDYFFLAIVMGYILSLMVLAVSTQVNSWYYLIFGIVAMFGLFLGAVLSNAWETFAGTSIMSGTITRFPITDLILNNYFPLFIAVMVICAMILLFGKRFLGTGEATR